MWSFKGMNIFMCVCCLRFVDSGEICGKPYEIPNWEPHWSEPPGTVILDTVQKDAADWIPELSAHIEDKREHFNLSLLANPFIKDGNCPPPNSNYLDLRKFHKSYSVIKDDNESKSMLFSHIFTGCYYVEMANAEGRKWIQDPVFYNTNYSYYNTMVECSKFELIPANYHSSMQLRYHIKIPLTCLRLQCQLFELHQKSNNTEHDLNAGILLATQECSVVNTGNGIAPVVKCKRNDTSPKLVATFVPGEKDQGWKALITWDHLGEGGASYYTRFIPWTNGCDRSDSSLIKWQPVFMFGALSHGYRNDTNTAKRIAETNFFYSPIFRIILYTLLGVTVMLILVYWMSKYTKILLEKKHAAKNLLVKLPEITFDQEEFNHILLIYAYDSPRVMSAMEALRGRLQQISQFPVHDLYSDDEFNIIIKLGATGWVENLLRDGSKVVWVDTPQFRSVLNDNKSSRSQPMQHKAGDF